MKSWKALLGVAVVFLLGVAAGAFFAGAVVKRGIDRILTGGPEATRDAIVRQMNSELALTPDQRAQVGKIVADGQAGIQKARATIQPEVRQVLIDCEQRIRRILTPAQAENFDRIVEQNRRTMRVFDRKEPGAPPTREAAPH